jgi:hypothetical protein
MRSLGERLGFTTDLVLHRGWGLVMIRFETATDSERSSIASNPGQDISLCILAPSGSTSRRDGHGWLPMQGTWGRSVRTVTC